MPTSFTNRRSIKTYFEMDAATYKVLLKLRDAMNIRERKGKWKENTNQLHQSSQKKIGENSYFANLSLETKI